MPDCQARPLSPLLPLRFPAANLRSHGRSIPRDLHRPAAAHGSGTPHPLPSLPDHPDCPRLRSLPECPRLRPPPDCPLPRSPSTLPRPCLLRFPPRIPQPPGLSPDHSIHSFLSLHSCCPSLLLPPGSLLSLRRHLCRPALPSPRFRPRP